MIERERRTQTGLDENLSFSAIDRNELEREIFQNELELLLTNSERFCPADTLRALFDLAAKGVEKIDLDVLVDAVPILPKFSPDLTQRGPVAWVVNTARSIIEDARTRAEMGRTLQMLQDRNFITASEEYFSYGRMFDPKSGTVSSGSVKYTYYALTEIGERLVGFLSGDTEPGEEQVISGSPQQERAEKMNPGRAGRL